MNAMKIHPFSSRIKSPSPDRLVADHDATLGQHLLDHPQAQGQAETEPDGMGNDHQRIAAASVESSTIGGHLRRLFGNYKLGQSAKLTASFGELDTLMPAYAATIHKSQGSEYPAVVIPILTRHCAMRQRNLLYTRVLFRVRS